MQKEIVLKTQIRVAQFESNSSSSHVISIGENDIYGRFFNQRAIRNGKVQLRNITELCEQDEWMRLYLPENILSFLIVSEIEGSVYTDKETTFFDDLAQIMPDVANQSVDILPVIRNNYSAVAQALSLLEKEYKLEFEFTVVTGKCPHFETNNLAAATGHFDDIKTLKRLLFNSQSYIELTPENAWFLPPREMATDTGETYVTPDYDEVLQQFDADLKSFTQRMETMAATRKKAGEE
jgi:hypothetical protein